jgi:DNA-binding XRE family transcriptional regulator
MKAGAASPAPPEPPPPAGLPELRGRLTLADGTTCVLIAETDYERLAEVLEAHELFRTLENPGTDWLDLDEWRQQTAAGRVAALRKELGLTQVQLARKVGLPQSQISRIERHPSRTTVRTLKRIARALHVDVRMLVP